MEHKKKRKQIKKFLEKFWFVVWKDDSIKGWLITIIFLFLVIKFIFFPALSLVTGTSLPLAIVESCSMYHDNNIFSDYEAWWNRHFSTYNSLSIDKETFEEFHFSNGFTKGDILFIVGVNPDDIKVGDVIIFQTNQAHPVIHRVIDIRTENGQRVFSTMGDNVGITQSFEKRITEDQIIGKASFRIAPYLGWAKLIFFEPGQPDYKKGFCHES